VKDIADATGTAHILAQRALVALLLINERNLSAPELVPLLNHRLKEKMKASVIHITISQHLAPSQGSQGSYDAGLSGASFTA
jgi:hypothetical protein